MKNLSGFTLFRTGKGWQLSIRVEGEDGWLVHAGFPDARAQTILQHVGGLLPTSQVTEASRTPGVLSLRPTRRRVILAEE